MAKRMILSALAVKAQAQAVAELCSSGALMICMSPVPASLGGSLNRSVVIAELGLAKKAFDVQDDGYMYSNMIYPSKAVKQGKAAWCCVVTSEGNPVFMGTVGLKNSNINLDDLDIMEGASVSVDVMVVRFPKKDNQGKQGA